jgi:hypothetical protein
VRLKNRYGEQRLENACRRALTYGDPSYKTIKNLLNKGLDHEEVLLPVVLLPAATFARSADELVGQLAQVQQWS